VDDKPSPNLFTLAGLGISIALCVAGGVVLGLYLDGVTHRSPLFALLGLVVGVAFAVVTAYLEIKKFL
jgi:F0F1-type ATP synthase assembly protein I